MSAHGADDPPLTDGQGPSAAAGPSAVRCPSVPVRSAPDTIQTKELPKGDQRHIAARFASAEQARAARHHPLPSASAQYRRRHHHRHRAAHRAPPPLTQGATTTPDLRITLDLDDHGYLTAVTDEPSPAADRALALLGFTRPRGQRHHLLDVDPGQRRDVATNCARLLTAAGYEVAATPALIPDADGPPRPDWAGEQILGDPTVAIARHPVLGITATIAVPGEGDVHQLITRTGFHYLPSHSMYVLPFDTPHDRALAAATELSRQLAAHHVPTAVSPAVHHPLPGQRLTDHPAPPTAVPADRRPGGRRWATRIAQYLRTVADRLLPGPPSSPAQPIPHTGTAWVQVPLRGPAPRWTPPTALPPAPGVVLRAHAARQTSTLQPTRSPAPTQSSAPTPPAQQPTTAQRRPR